MSDRRDAEYLVVNLARAIRPNEIVFSGVNSVLPMAACVLAKNAYDFDFTYLSVAGGVNVFPKRLPRSSTDPALLAGTAAIFSNADFYDLATRKKLDLIYLGAAQVDALGRTNVSAIGDWAHPKVRLPGGGGAAVMMPVAPRVALWRTEHSKRTLVEKLEFITAAGNTAVLVTPYAVFERDPVKNERLHLATYRDDITPEVIAERTGFSFDASRAAQTPPIAARESTALEEMDAYELLENELPRSG